MSTDNKGVGVTFAALDEHLMLKALPGVFCRRAGAGTLEYVHRTESKINQLKQYVI